MYAKAYAGSLYQLNVSKARFISFSIEYDAFALPVQRETTRKLYVALLFHGFAMKSTARVQCALSTVAS